MFFSAIRKANTSAASVRGKPAPGIRQSCHAQHCGQRSYLYGDLQNVRLAPSLIAEPPLELWPEIITRSEIPADVHKELITHL